MAASKSIISFKPPLLAILLTLSNSLTLTTSSCFTAIFSFGDSLTDTGNYLFSVDGEDTSGRFPYGETYFKRPTGRFSDGRVVVDFIAQAMGLPLLPPYLAGAEGEGFRRGVNFAVGGVTALDNDVFREKGLDVSWTEYSLRAQVEWFKQLLPSLCASDAECKEMFSSSLFLMGEIGGNDYNYLFIQGRTLEEIQTYVPHVVNAISSAIEVLIELGATTLVVPGNLPIGCISIYLTMFQSQQIEEYDPHTGCIKWLNEFSDHGHNRQLKDKLDRLRQRHPHTTIIYADYYQAIMRVFRSPSQYGFGETPLAACCGGDGPYKVNLSVLCGNLGSTVCDDPTKYICWDGTHLTEAAYKAIADGFLTGPYASPNVTSLCSLGEPSVDQLHSVF